LFDFSKEVESIENVIKPKKGTPPGNFVLDFAKNLRYPFLWIFNPCDFTVERQLFLGILIFTESKKAFVSDSKANLKKSLETRPAQILSLTLNSNFSFSFLERAEADTVDGVEKVFNHLCWMAGTFYLLVFFPFWR